MGAIIADCFIIAVNNILISSAMPVMTHLILPANPRQPMVSVQKQHHKCKAQIYHTEE